MKTTFFTKAFSFILLLMIFTKLSIAQDNKIIAEVHNLMLDNTSKDKVIQIRFLNCSKNEFENLYKKALQSTNLFVIKQAYSSENLIGSVYFSKSSDITTNDVKILLNELQITNAMFNEKKLLVSELTNYQFTKKEKATNQEQTEK